MQDNAPVTTLPATDAVEALGDTMKQLLSPADHELVDSERVRTLVAYVEQWAQKYDAEAGEMATDEMEMLKKTRTELSHILNERLTLENEGGQPASKIQAERMEHVAAAICRIDQVLPHAEAICTEPMRQSA